MTNLGLVVTRISALAVGAFLCQIAYAGCQCLCVNGNVEAVCSSSIDVPPPCAPRVCPIVPPSVHPIDPPRVPPVGTSNCHSEQVWNGEEYVWTEICR